VFLGEPTTQDVAKMGTAYYSNTRRCESGLHREDWWVWGLLCATRALRYSLPTIQRVPSFLISKDKAKTERSLLLWVFSYFLNLALLIFIIFNFLPPHLSILLHDCTSKHMVTFAYLLVADCWNNLWSNNVRKTFGPGIDGACLQCLQWGGWARRIMN
jgi:hypothetical protein